jgi:DNA-3-methyladenine glycosylase
VLIRALEPVIGIEVMKRNRGFPKSAGVTQTLTNGPAKLCQALGIGRKENGTDLVGDEIYLTEEESIHKPDIGTSTRIGISRGKEKKWRFFVRGSKWVSK